MYNHIYGGINTWSKFDVTAIVLHKKYPSNYNVLHKAITDLCAKVQIFTIYGF